MFRVNATNFSIGLKRVNSYNIAYNVSLFCHASSPALAISISLIVLIKRQRKRLKLLLTK